MSNKNPFEIDDDIEDAPIIKAPSHAIKTVSNSAARYSAKQAKALGKAFVSQLYGSSKAQAAAAAAGSTATDDDQHQTSAVKSDPIAQIKKTLSTPVYFHPSVQKGQKATSSSNPATIVGKTEEEQEQINETRKMLYHHKQDYYDTTLGRMNDLDQDVRKKRHEREQEEKQKEQQELEAEKRKKEEEEKQKQQQLVVPKGKIRGQPPQVLRRSQTKAEVKVIGSA